MRLTLSRCLLAVTTSLSVFWVRQDHHAALHGCRTPSLKVLEKAAVKVKPAGAFDRWLVTLTEVEELKCVIRLLPIFLTLIVYNAIYAQVRKLVRE